MSNMAIAYAMKKKKKMAKGGEVTHEAAQERLRGVHTSRYPKSNPGESRSHTAYDNPQLGLTKEARRGAHKENLEELKSMKNPDIKGLAEGGVVMDEEDGYAEMPQEHEMADMPAESEDDDMIARIMSKRNMYSEGGRVANEGEANLGHLADSDLNNFDDLSMRDDLESSYTGENSGDHLGNEQMEADMHDIVSRIMASRKKKDRMPSPA